MKKIAAIIAIFALVGIGAWVIKAKQNNGVKDAGGKKIVKMINPRDIEESKFIYEFGEENGFFAKNNIEVQKIEANKDFSPMLNSGAADVMVGPFSGPLTSFLNGGQNRILADITTPYLYYGVSRFAPDKFSAIKKVAINTLAGDPPITAREALKAMGVNADDVEFIAVPPQESRIAMLEKGDIDFTIIASEKFIKDNKLSEKFTLVQPEQIIAESKLIRSITTTQRAINENPKGLEGFVEAIYQTIQFIKNNPQETKKFLVNKYGYSEEAANNFYERFMSASKGVSFVPKIETLNAAADEVIKVQDIKSDKNLKDYIYSNFGEKAVSGK